MFISDSEPFYRKLATHAIKGCREGKKTLKIKNLIENSISRKHKEMSQNEFCTSSLIEPISHISPWNLKKQFACGASFINDQQIRGLGVC